MTNNTCDGAGCQATGGRFHRLDNLVAGGRDVAGFRAAASRFGLDLLNYYLRGGLPTEGESGTMRRLFIGTKSCFLFLLTQGKPAMFKEKI